MAFRYHGGPHKLGATTVTAYTGTAGTQAAFTEQGVIRVVLTTLGFINITAAGTAATTSHMPIAANTPEYFQVDVGDQISGIQSASGGNMHVTFCDR